MLGYKPSALGYAAGCAATSSTTALTRLTLRVLRSFTGSNPGGLNQLDALLSQFKGELISELDLAGV